MSETLATDDQRSEAIAAGARAAAPQSPHDDLPFEELARRYNFEQTSGDMVAFARLVIKECQAGRAAGGSADDGRAVRVLDIGCGRGIARNVGLQWAIRPHVEEFWGLEPDESVQPARGLFDRHVAALMDDRVDLPEGHFDLAYAWMVMEHVEHPEAFLRAVRRCLRPGGTFLFATPNRRHYFTRTASILHALRADELVLRLLKRGGEESYHYPVRYRFNTEKIVARHAAAAGLAEPEFVYLEARGPRGYLPGPLSPIFHALAWKRRVWRRPEALLTLIGRIRRPTE